MLIRSGSFKFLWAMFLTLDPVLSTSRKVPNWTYLVPTSSEMFNTLLSAHVNFSSSGRVGLVLGYAWWAGSVEVTGSYYKTESIKCVTHLIRHVL